MDMNDKMNNPKFGMRAPPRRRIKTEDFDDQPVFLRKAFVMMNNCPPEIGGWSDRGDTVIIKDVKLFAEKIIPTAYKHNNFSSFVRQLNFYGFRKVKSEALDQSSWWEFRHPQFLRDQPHLLSEIKRSIQYAPDPSNGQEVNDLKHQVGSLNDKIDMLTDQIDALTNIVNNMQLNQQNVEPNYGNNDTFGKKRKINKSNGGGLPDAVSFSRMCSIDESRIINNGLALNVPSGPELQQLDLFRQNSLSGQSCVSLSEMDSDVNDINSFWGEDLENLLTFDDESPIPATSIKASYADSASAYSTLNQESIPHASVVSAAPAVTGVQDLFSVLETLSPELKIRFVDKLAEVMGKQLMASPTATEVSAVPQASLNNHGDRKLQAKMQQDWNSKLSASQSSSSSGSLSPSRSFAQLTSGVDAPYHLPSGVRAPEIALPLASAALGAFVMSSLNSLTSQPLTPHIKQEVV